MKQLLVFPCFFLSMLTSADDETSPARTESSPEHFATAEVPNLPRNSKPWLNQRPFATDSGYYIPYPGLGYAPMYYANIPGARHAPMVSGERNEKLTNLISAQTEAINSLFEVVKTLEKRLDDIEGKLP